MSKDAQKEKHVPMRMCAVTHEKVPKKDLVRFGVVDGKVSVDKDGKIKSRGVNIKPDKTVFEKAVKKGCFSRLLGKPVGSEEIERLRKEFDEYIDSRFREQKVVRVSLEQITKLGGKISNGGK